MVIRTWKLSGQTGPWSFARMLCDGQNVDTLQTGHADDKFRDGYLADTFEYITHRQYSGGHSIDKLRDGYIP